jgi:hypothetical protein
VFKGLTVGSIFHFALFVSLRETKKTLCLCAFLSSCQEKLRVISQKNFVSLSLRAFVSKKIAFTRIHAFAAITKHQPLSSLPEKPLVAFLLFGFL